MKDRETEEVHKQKIMNTKTSKMGRYSLKQRGNLPPTSHTLCMSIKRIIRVSTYVHNAQNTWSMHVRLRRNPYCNSPIEHSVPSLVLLISPLPCNLPTILNILILLDLLHSHLSLFLLDKSTIHSPSQSTGMLQYQKYIQVSVTMSHHLLSNTAGKPSMPRAFPAFI